MKGSPDLEYAEKVATFLGTKHTSIVVSEDEFFDSIPDVIYHIESYDTTTVRASVGNYLVSKYIRENSQAKSSLMEMVQMKSRVDIYIYIVVQMHLSLTKNVVDW
jgi:asparagine synthetase B (glutamine-hydrolysing)